MLYYNIHHSLKWSEDVILAGHIGKIAMTLGAMLVSGQLYAHSHGHQMTEAEQKAANGVFDDKDVKDRPLSNWDGVWQSVYPFLLSSDLDPVFKKKVEKDNSKTFEEVKAYYRTGYTTDVETIGIENNVMEFHTGKNVSRCEYVSNGYKILTYASGKKGVRYLFECKDASSKAPKFVQFSDHTIGPRQSAHFHIFMGNTSHEALLKEMDNWPVVEEMLHH